MSDKNFKFVVMKPTKEPNRWALRHAVTIYAKAPQVASVVLLSPNLNAEDALRLMKAELKLAMVEAILNGEWEFERG